MIGTEFNPQKTVGSVSQNIGRMQPEIKVLFIRDSRIQKCSLVAVAAMIRREIYESVITILLVELWKLISHSLWIGHMLQFKELTEQKFSY